MPRWLAPAAVASLALALAWRPGELTAPPHGEHAWRDADGIGVARSFVREGFDLWRPRVVERQDTDGVVGMELPLVNAAGAAFMEVGGIRDLWARLPCWLALVPLALAGWRLARSWLADARAAALASAVLVLQPLVILYARKCMPEIPMLAALVAGVALARESLASDGMSKGLVLATGSGLALAAAAVMKPTGYAVAVPVGLWALARWRDPRRSRTAVGGAVALIAGLPLLAAGIWYVHARALGASGLPLFRLHHDWLSWTHEVGTATFWTTILGRLLHTMLLWPTVAAMVLRPRQVLQTLSAHADLFAWAAASLLAVILFGAQNYQHPYYALPLVIPVALIAADFAVRAADSLPGSTWALAGFWGAFAITAVVRVEQRRAPVGFDALRVEKAMAGLPSVLTVATDEHSPVVSLVILDRTGWALTAAALTPATLRDLQRRGARLLVESSFGGWLGPEARASLPAPLYADDQLRAYELRVITTP